MVNPDQIQKKEFTVRRVRGYDPAEVDDFLDEIVISYRDVLAQLHAAQVEASRLRSAQTQQLPLVQNNNTTLPPPVAAVPQGLYDASRILAVAQQVADQQLAEAKVIADAKIVEAHSQAGSLVADGQNQADALIAAGNTKRNEIVGELELKREELQNKVDSLTVEHAAVRDRLTAALSSLGGATNG